MKKTAKTQKTYTVPGDIELGGKRFSYLLTYKPIRNMYLRVKAGGLLSVTLPFGVPVERAEAFLTREREAVLRLTEEKNVTHPAFEGRTGDVLPVLGVPHTIRVEVGRRPGVERRSGELLLTVKNPENKEERLRVLKSWVHRESEAMLTALDTGMVAAYITDFPNNRLLTAPHVIAMPHLGASTPESEQNCAAMAVDTLRDYLESGNIRSSVNLPEMTMDRSGVQRLCVLHKNVPGMLANITSLFGRDGVNVENLSNKSRGDYAYTMVDLGSKVGDNVIEDVRRTANVIRVRSLEW